jgi:hypothetical protein
MVPLLRNLWNEKRNEIISSVIDSRGRLESVDREILADIMGSVFDRFEAVTTRLTHGNISEINGSSVAISDATRKELDSWFEFGDGLAHEGLSQIVGPDLDAGCVADVGNYYYL